MISLRARFSITIISAMAGRSIVEFILLLFRISSIHLFVYTVLFCVATFVVTFELEKVILSKGE